MADAHLTDEELLDAPDAHPHLEACPGCRERREGLGRLARLLSEPDAVPRPVWPDWRAPEARARHRARAWASAAAACLLAALAWQFLGNPGASAPPAVPAEAALLQRWVQGEAPAHGVPLYLTPDCRVTLSKGSHASVRSEGAGILLRLEAGGLAWMNLGWTRISVETPFGVLQQAPGEALEAEIALMSSEPSGKGLADLLFKEASAADRPKGEVEGPCLVVGLRRGALTLERPEGPPIAMQAGQQMTVTSGGHSLRAIVPSAGPEERRAVVLNPAVPLEISGEPASLPFPGFPAGPDLPAGSGMAWEVEVMAAAPASLGVAFETAGRLRLWHLGPELGSGQWRRLRVVAREGWAQGWVDGRMLMSTDCAAESLQDSPCDRPGLVVWGSARLRQVKGEVLP